MISRWTGLLLTLFFTLPWLILRFTLFSGGTHGADTDPVVLAVLSGVAIMASAFLLSWGGEVAQLSISQALALAFLAFIAVLPEYSVDMYFSWMAGKDFAKYHDFPVANMTGANRLLIGVGWPAVLVAQWLRNRKAVLELGTDRRIELGYLLLATLYSFVLPFKGTLSFLDAGVFILLFVMYMRKASGAAHVEPELHGTAARIALLPRKARHAAVLACFVYAGAVILLSAEPFAEGLVASGRRFGVNEFLLVQWLAPLASEAPEFIVALLFAWKGAAAAGMGALVSSKVNQWTLLVGLIPVVFAASRGSTDALVLSSRQADELLLTSAQSAFAIAVMADLRLAWWEALLLFLTFAGQFVFPGTSQHHAIAVGYIVLTVLLIGTSRERRASLRAMLRSL